VLRISPNTMHHRHSHQLGIMNSDVGFNNNMPHHDEMTFTVSTAPGSSADHPPRVDSRDLVDRPQRLVSTPRGKTTCEPGRLLR